MPNLTFTVIDAETGKGIRGIKVKVYFDITEITDPNASPDLYLLTDENGVASETVSWSIDAHCGVGVIAEGYEAANSEYKPPSGWEDKWTCWYEFDYTQTDFSYEFRLSYIGVPPLSIPERIAQIINQLTNAFVNSVVSVFIMGLVYVTVKGKS